MKIIKYSLFDFWHDKKRLFIFFIQIFFAEFLLYGAYVHLIEYIPFYKTVNEIYENLEDDWYLQDLSKKDSLEVLTKQQCNKLENEILKKLNGKVFSFMASSQQIEDKRLPDKFAEDIFDRRRFFTAFYCTSYLPIEYKWQVSSGRLFSEREYVNKSDKIPIIVGCKLGQYVNVGDIIDDNFVVVGVLKKGSFYLDPRWEGKVEKLDTTIVVPFIYMKDMLRQAFFNELNIKTSDRLTVKEVKEMLNDAGVKKIHFRPMKKQLINIHKDMNYKIIYELCYGIMILVMSVAGEALSLLCRMKRRLPEYSVHILCGGTVKDVFLRSACGEFAVIVAADVAIGLFYKSFGFFVLCIILNSIVVIVTLAVPFVKMRKVMIADMLKRKE